MKLIVSPAVFSFFLLAGCHSKKVTVVFRNESSIHLDSTIITINNYSITLPAIVPGSRYKGSIPEDSININPHHVRVTAIPFDKNNTNFKGGFFYDDLFMPNKSVYTLVLRPDSTVDMEYGY